MILFEKHRLCSNRRSERRISAPTAAAILSCTVALGVALTGCSSSTSTDTTTSAEATTTSTSAETTTSAEASADNAADLVAASAKTTQTMRAIHIDLTATDLPKFPVETVNADVTSIEQGNGQAIGSATFRLTPDAPFEPYDFLVTEKTFYIKTPDGGWESKGPSQEIYDPAVILAKDKGLGSLLSGITDPKNEGTETIDGIETVKVSGTIDGAIVDPIVPSLGEGGGQLPITVWIANVPADSAPDTPLPSEAPSPGTGPNLVRMMIANGDGGSAEATFSKWAVPVEIPTP